MSTEGTAYLGRWSMLDKIRSSLLKNDPLYHFLPISISRPSHLSISSGISEGKHTGCTVMVNSSSSPSNSTKEISKYACKK